MNLIESKPIPTAVDAAIAKKTSAAPPAERSLTEQVFDELARPLPTLVAGNRASKRVFPKEIFRDGKVVVASKPDVLTAAMALVPDNPLCSAEQRAKLRDFEAAQRADLAAANQISPQAASDKFYSQRQEAAASISAGGPVMGAVATRSKESIANDYQIRRGALLSRMVARTASFMAIASPILDEARSRIENWLEAREANERQEAALLGVAWLPSVVWQAGVNLALRFERDRVPKLGHFDFPSHVLSGLVDLQG